MEYVVWYGYRSVLLRSEVQYIAKFTRPNGSNMYMVRSSEVNRLPPSHVPITIRFQEESIEDVETIAMNIQGRVNEYLTARGSVMNIVDDVIHDGEITYTAVYLDGGPVTMEEGALNRLRAAIETLPNAIENPLPSTPHAVFDEVPIVSLSIDVSGGLLTVEYIAKNAFIYAAAHNQWLKPYANRIGWKSVDSLGRSISRILVPAWDEHDEDMYSEMLSELPVNFVLPKVQARWSRGCIRLSDRRWYPLVDSVMRYVEDVRLPTDDRTVIFMDKKFPREETLSKTIPYVDWRLLDLCRVWKECCDGLLPFDVMYPTVTYDDADERITFVDTGSGIAVVLNPGNYMLGLYPTDNGLDRFKRWWREGYVLTHHGHYVYENAYEPIDEMDIVFVGRFVGDL